MFQTASPLMVKWIVLVVAVLMKEPLGTLGKDLYLNQSLVELSPSFSVNYINKCTGFAHLDDSSLLDLIFSCFYLSFNKRLCGQTLQHNDAFTALIQAESPLHLRNIFC